MTATIVESERSSERELRSLRTRVADLQRATEGLNQSLAASRLRREKLVAERGPLVVPARSQKNADAQKRLQAIDEQLAPLARDIADDEAAVSELNEQLGLAQDAVEREEWELRRAAVRRMIEERLKGKTLAAMS